MTCTCGFQHLAPHLEATCTCEGDEMDAMASETVDERPRVWDCSECGHVNGALVVVCGNCDGRRRAHLYVKSEPAEPWLTSALPDGGVGDRLESGTGEFFHWRDGKSGPRWYQDGDPECGGLLDTSRWRWVTRPASEAPKVGTWTVAPGDRAWSCGCIPARLIRVDVEEHWRCGYVRPASEASEQEQEVQDEFEGDYHVSEDAPSEPEALSRDKSAEQAARLAFQAGLQAGAAMDKGAFVSDDDVDAEWAIVLATLRDSGWVR